ncbi:Protein MAIN-LIKE 1 [Glycine max]|uniref:protein MAIN-LIKE 1-like n=1 Tax=Glycine soja TaxID=3848 RepID=UPI00023D077F|nr:protein MAIN-LIKE 1-like [Glycine soja]KAH1222257.1 Protein MAIN-LIKE 1 [Glycine max]
MIEDVPAPGAEGLVGDGAEGLAGDGAKGVAGDDAEGFPGGPRDPSVLTSFADHVAHSIWNGEERPKLKLAFHGRKVEKFGSPALEIEGLVVAIELTPLIACSVDTGDRGDISAFFEKWHKETSSFHPPVGELTITLDDVASLLHLSIIGTFHSFEPLHVDEAVIMLVELLERRCEARHWIVAARAYLLHLVGCTFFANKSATHVHVVHLDAFGDLARSGSYAWGVAAPVHMYDQLNDASQSTGRQLAGYITLLQCWIYKQFPSVHESVTNDGYDETTPHVCQWLTTKDYMKGLTTSSYRTRIDALTIPNAADQPRHPLVPQHEAYVEPDIPEVLVAPEAGPSQATDLPKHAVDACEAISERLERVFNLSMVTEGTELHDLMEDCLRIVLRCLASVPNPSK